MLAFLSNGPRFLFCLSPFFVAVMKYPMTKAPCRKKGLFRAYSSEGVGGCHHQARVHGGRQAWHRDSSCKLILTHRQEAQSTLATAGRFRSLRVFPEIHLLQGHTPESFPYVFTNWRPSIWAYRGHCTQSTTLLCSFSSGSESGREVGCFTLDITRSH